MPFLPGNKANQNGRPKGTKNKRTREFYEALERNNFDPAQALIDCYNEAKKQYARAVISEQENAPSSTLKLESDIPKYLKIAGDLAEKIATYSYPKLKSVERTDPILLEIIERIKQLKDLPPAELLRIAEAKLIEAKTEEPKKDV